VGSASHLSIHGRLDFLDHLGCIDDLFAVHVPAFFRPHLVLDVDGRNPGLLILLYRANYIDGIAVTGIGIGDKGDLHGGSDAPCILHHLRHRKQTDIRKGKMRCRGSVSGHINGRETARFDYSRPQCIIHPRRLNEFSSFQHLSHFYPSHAALPFPGRIQRLLVIEEV